MTLVWTRVDQKLIHGQISAAWVPHLNVDAIVVSDNDVVDDPWVQKVLTMALPPEIVLTRFTEPALLSELLAEEELSARRVLVIFKSVTGVMEALEAGFSPDTLNLGNQACRPSSTTIRLNDTFYVSHSDLDNLIELSVSGMGVILQAVPWGKAVKWTPPKL